MVNQAHNLMPEDLARLRQQAEDGDARSLQMRVFVLGVVITIALRYFPRGILPEMVRRER